MKKICFISTNDGVRYGGSEVLWSEAALTLAKKHKKDVKVLISTTKWEPTADHISKLEINGAEIYYKKKEIPPWYWRLLLRLVKHKIQYPQKQKFDSSILEETKLDLVVFSLGSQTDVLRLDIEFCINNKIPFVLIVQLAKEFHIPYDKQLSRISKNYLSALRVYFVSQQNKEIIEESIANSIIHSELISNPFPMKWNEKIAYPSTSEGYNIAFVASLSSNHKGHDVLFKVLSQSKWKQRNLVVNLYGEGPHSNYLEKLKIYFGLNNVVFKGKYTSLQQLWSENHASILCSRFEGQSLALLESIAYNRMCIATNVGDATLLIKDGQTGFIAEAATPKLIDDALERAWNCRDNWSEMGEMGGSALKKLKENMNPVDDFSKKILELVNSIES
jgi:glycosyltransferase involved in cell wall biosynthesis